MDWADQFEPMDNHISKDGSDHFETYGPDFEYVKEIFEKEPGRVWTAMDADGALVVGDGLHHVNRIYYLITKHPAQSNTTYEVYDEDDRIDNAQMDDDGY